MHPAAKDVLLGKEGKECCRDRLSRNSQYEDYPYRNQIRHTRRHEESMAIHEREKAHRCFRCSLENFGAFDYIDNQDNNAIRHVTILPLYALSLFRNNFLILQSNFYTMKILFILILWFYINVEAEC